MRDIEDSNNTINQFDLTDSYKLLCQKTAEYSGFLGACKTFNIR